jgi:hypothetical protein
MLTVVTNLGNIFYIVKGKSFNIDKAIRIFNEAVSANNNAVGFEKLKEASEYFLKNCFKAGIIYDDR